MYKYIFIFLLLFITCSDSNIQRCPEIIYNSINKLTSLPYGSLYTGRCVVYDGDLKKSIQQYLDGVDYGNWVFYFPNGKIETKGKFRNGVRVGKWKYYYESGALRQVSSYSKTGQRSGKWTVYKENGDIIEVVNYD